MLIFARADRPHAPVPVQLRAPAGNPPDRDRQIAPSQDHSSPPRSVSLAGGKGKPRIAAVHHARRPPAATRGRTTPGGRGRPRGGIAEMRHHARRPHAAAAAGRNRGDCGIDAPQRPAANSRAGAASDLADYSSPPEIASLEAWFKLASSGGSWAIW